MTNTQTTTAKKAGRYSRAMIALVAALALAASLLLTRAEEPAQAAFPGQNGKIAFESDRDGNLEIYTMNPDGSGQTNLTKDEDTDVNPAVSPDGTKIVFQSTRDGNSEIYVMNADGSGLKNLTSDPSSDGAPSFSPDGKKIVFQSNRDGVVSNFGTTTDIYTMNPDGSGLKRLTTDPGFDTSPVFSPDGTRIAFQSTRDAADNPNAFPPSNIYVMAADGSSETPLTTDPASDSDPAFSPDGRKIAFSSNRDGSDFEVYVMTASGDNETPFTNNFPADDRDPAFSPDGTKIAFDSNRDGDLDVYTMRASDGANVRNRTNNDDSPASDFQPDWATKGNSAPVVVPISPKPDSSIADRTPTIRAKASDKETELFKANIRLFVDGNEKTTFTYDRVLDRLSFTPSSALKAGKHTVKVVATDASNKSTTKSWSFTIQ